jgi:hypothetical protein
MTEFAINILARALMTDRTDCEIGDANRVRDAAVNLVRAEAALRNAIRIMKLNQRALASWRHDPLPF